MASPSKMNNTLRLTNFRYLLKFVFIRYLAVSQMEAPDARRAFPCFDEPNMKAIFSVTLGRHRDMTALSNMPLINTTQMQVTLHHLNLFIIQHPFSIFVTFCIRR